MVTRRAAEPAARPSDREVAAAAASAAAAVVREALGRPVAVEAKTSLTDPVTDVDRAAEAAAAAVLEAHRPRDGRLGEEGGATDGTSGRRWTIDALDGTLNFVSGLPLCCCAVGLEDRAGGLAAAVADPVRGEAFSAARGGGAWCDGLRLGPPATRRAPEVGGAVVGTYLHGAQAPELDGLRALLGAGAQVRILGSGSLELAWVAAGRLDAWIQRDPAPWDWLPGAVLVAEAAGVATGLGDEAGWHVAASSPELHAQIARVLTA